MKSRHSASLLLVWRIAEFEARNLNASKIEPPHLLLGLSKVVDLDLPEMVSKNAPDRDEILEELLREVRKLRTIFRVADVDARALRRSLRRRSQERRFSLDDSEQLHRSSAAKIVFADAEHFAQLGNCAVYPVHLLYAALLAEDDRRDAIFHKLGIDKTRLLSVSKRDALAVQIGPASSSQRERTRWN
jgi:Clp amino terminal domain, pathogenicity island component